MDVFLFGLDLNGDIDDYAALLAAHGLKNPGDLMMNEPGLDDLISYGILDVDDVEKIYAAIHPEKKPSSLPSIDEILLDTIGGPEAPFDAANELEKLLGAVKEPAGFDAEVYKKGKQLVENRNAMAVKAYIESMDVNMVDPSDDNTLLHWAVYHNSKEIVGYLLDKGAKELKNKYDNTPLELAIEMIAHGDSSFIPVRNFIWERTEQAFGIKK